jgi:RNA polymerase sigma-70 factor (ECF subfamily)
MDSGEASDDVAVDEGTPQLQALRGEQQALLRGLLEDLPEPQADALTLRVLFELSIEQIARASGVSVNTVKTRLRLAKDALRRRIAENPSLRTTLGVVR